MIILPVHQETEQWHAARAKHYRTASRAPTIMGANKYQTRNDLMAELKAGIAREVDANTQALFDAGHAAEDAARKIVEGHLKAPLLPITCTDDVGYLLASFDGINEEKKTGWEHKLWREDLAAQVRAKQLDPMYYWQLEQQILVGGLDMVIFTCSDGTPEKCVHMRYVPVAGRAEQLLAGWKQFERDLADYQHVEVLPPVTAAPTMALPALSIQVQGSISLIDNLAVFGEGLKSFIALIPEKPETDQEFADCKEACKRLQEAQDALDAAEAHALGQIQSFDEMKRTKALYFDLARNTRLAVEKMVAARETQIKVEIRQAANDAFALHVANLNTRIGKPYLNLPIPDFAGAMKGKRTIASLHDACDTLMAAQKIAANEVADRIQINLNSLRDLAGEHKFLFADAAQLVLKGNDDLVNLIKLRISDHKAAEQKRLDAERERIRAEEQTKAEARAKVEAEQKAAAPAPVPPASPTSTEAAPDTKQVAAVPAITPQDIGQTVAIDYPAAIRAFLATRKEPTKKISEMRAVLSEFCKFIQK